jgi:DNA-binding XRE family transcriptional regulator
MKDTIKRIVAVQAAEASHTVAVTWEDGKSSRVDLGVLVDRTPVFAPLRAASLFRQVQVGEDGWEIVWPGSEDLAVDAHHLARMAMEQSGEAMPPETFRAWRAAHGLSLTRAAQVLGLSRRTVAYYESGARIIPKLVRLACKGAETELRA